MTGFSIGLNTGLNYLKKADGSVNQFAPEYCKKDNVATSAEIGARLVELQNNPQKNQAEGSFWQTVMTGNDGQGYYDLIAKLDGEAGISQNDLKKLATLGGGNNKIDQQDFSALKNSNNAQATSNTADKPNRFLPNLMAFINQYGSSGPVNPQLPHGARPKPLPKPSQKPTAQNQNSWGNQQTANNSNTQNSNTIPDWYIQLSNINQVGSSGSSPSVPLWYSQITDPSLIGNGPMPEIPQWYQNIMAQFSGNIG